MVYCIFISFSVCESVPEFFYGKFFVSLSVILLPIKSPVASAVLWTGLFEVGFSASGTDFLSWWRSYWLHLLRVFLLIFSPKFMICMMSLGWGFWYLLNSNILVSSDGITTLKIFIFTCFLCESNIFFDVIPLANGKIEKMVKFLFLQ